MTDEKQEGQKTIVSFIVGLLIGGLLVWAFSGPSVEAPKKDTKNDTDKTEEVEVSDDESTNEENTTSTEVSTPTLSIGEGKVTVGDQTASNFVTLASATYPVAEGWIGVRDYSDGRLGGLLGVARFSEEQGLVPTGIPLQRATISGKEYAVVVYTESGDRKFNLAEDKQLDSVFATFTAN
jgi:hypothetical protein